MYYVFGVEIDVVIHTGIRKFGKLKFNKNMFFVVKTTITRTLQYYYDVVL